jgi:low affinity Fe/Cu permease
MAMTSVDPQSLSSPPAAGSRRPGRTTAFAHLAEMVSRAVGRPWAFMLAAATVLIWAVSGPLFGFSDTWQLVINTGTTIITFLMVFLIQNAQMRDAAAIQVKLDELIRVSRAQNVFVGIEHLSDEELEQIRDECERRAAGDAPSRLVDF